MEDDTFTVVALYIESKKQYLKVQCMGSDLWWVLS